MKQNDLISRKALMEEIGAIECSQSCDFCVATNCRIGQIVKTAPAVEANPVVNGRWIQDGGLDEDGNGQYHCSVCSAGENHNPIVDVPYCWKCGAKMDGERRTDNDSND